MEYARYGDGFAMREDADAEWREVSVEEIPLDDLQAIQTVEERKERVAQHGYDPDDPPVPFAVIKRAGEG